MSDFGELSYLFMEQSPEHSLDLCDIKTWLLSGPQRAILSPSKVSRLLPLLAETGVGQRPMLPDTGERTASRIGCPGPSGCEEWASGSPILTGLTCSEATAEVCSSLRRGLKSL